MIQFELTFVNGVKSVSRFNFLHVDVSFSITTCSRDYLCYIAIYYFVFVRLSKIS